jgi:alpha-ketoglutarate-dependent taurine dioxygenase
MSKNNIEDIYPLSPMQKGLLFHTLCAPMSGVYVTQLSWTLDGDLDAAVFRRAWEALTERHPILRTSFVWEGRSKPLQVVHKQITLPLVVEDWRGLSAERQEEQVRRFLEADKEKDFALTKAPLMRLRLIRVEDNRYQFIWSFHHLLLDGWSVPLVFEELFALYHRIERGGELPAERPRPFRDYISWLKRQDMSGAEAFWRRLLKGFKTPTPLDLAGGAKSSPGREPAHDKRRSKISREATSALNAFAREHQLTLNSLVQGAWALLLGHYSGERDVVFGAVVSGRPAELEGVETMIGLFINTLPVRVRIDEAEEVCGWLRRLQSEVAEMRQYEYSPLVEVQGWSDLSRGNTLFESILVFQNYPAEDALDKQRKQGRELSAEELRCTDQNSYPITVTSGPAPEMPLEFAYDANRFDGDLMCQVLGQLEAVLANIVAKPRARVGELLEALDETERQKKMAEGSERAKLNLSRFKSTKPKPVNLSSEELVKMEPLRPGVTLPLVFTPLAAGVDLAEWTAGHAALVESKLAQHGALLFRGFGVQSAPDFERFAQAVCPGLFNENGEHPRESVSGNVYTPVFYPPEKQLLWHNENSFNARWPTRIMFCCAEPAQEGGETPIVDSRQVFELLDPQIKERFMRENVMYVRNYGGGLGLDWQKVFRTSDRAEAEARCRAASMDFEWKGDAHLKTSCVRPAVVRHPETGEMSWFNQAQHWHPSCLDPEVRDSLLASFAEPDLPRNCYYGDGSPIEDVTMDEIRRVYRQLEVSFAWQKGDIMLLDNLLAAHGRNPFRGERKLLVAMGRLLDYDNVETTPREERELAVA